MKNLLLAVLCIFISCEQDAIVDTVKVDGLSEEFVFFYKGEKYDTELIKTKSGDGKFADSRVETLVEDFKNNTGLAAFVYPDGVVEYFDNQDDLKRSLEKMSVVSNRGTLSRTVGGTLTVYQKDKRGGRSISKTLNTSVKSIEVSCEELKSVKLHDEISSIVMTCQYVEDPMFDINHTPNKCIATFYEHEKFEGYSIWFAVDPLISNKTVDYIKSYPLYPGSNLNWNDRISSVRFSYPNW